MDRHPEPILHVDMDAFFASIEQRDDPSLRGRPVAVGSASDRGVVAAASYEARAFGVGSAMPMVRARRHCPDLVVVPPRFERYHEVSAALRTILVSVTPLVEPLSLDEAFLDVAGAVRIFGDPPTIAAHVRAEVRGALDLPCSVGVGPTKSVAKLLSARAKPDGILHWPAGEVAERLRPLPVGVLWGAGPRTVERLHAYGLTTVGQVADAPVSTLVRVVGDALGRQLHDLAHGIDPRPVVPEETARSISAESTFETDIDDPVALERRVLGLATGVAARLRREGTRARTVTLKVRFADFTTITRSHTLAAPTDRTRDVTTVALGLLDALRLERVRVRLLGVRVANLTDADVVEQLTFDAGDAGVVLAGEDRRRWGDLDRASDAITSRFGRDSVSYAALLDDADPDGPTTRPTVSDDQD